MKTNIPIVAFTFLLLVGCKTETKKETPLPEKETTILEKVANAHGFEAWKNVQELKFTFNVDRDTTHFERSWIWNTHANTITAIGGNDTLTYNRGNMDSTAQKTNGGFINDKYWLLAPFNLVWDKDNITWKHSLEAEAPVGKKTMQKLTIVYGNEGGYTPGDAYDLYFGDDYLLKEWAYRKGNSPEISMSTTWEDYVDKGGLKIATVHKNDVGNFKLFFSGIEVDLK
ncbi:MAG: hypothetical protein V7724_15205 [Sediminicola sp.]